MSYLELSTHSWLFSVLWPVLCLCSDCCPPQKEDSVTNMRSLQTYGYKYKYFKMSSNSRYQHACASTYHPCLCPPNSCTAHYLESQFLRTHFSWLVLRPRWGCNSVDRMLAWQAQNTGFNPRHCTKPDMMCYTCVLALGRWRKVDQKFKVILGSKCLEANLGYVRPHLKTKTKFKVQAFRN